jgi:hypothetical protein
LAFIARVSVVTVRVYAFIAEVDCMGFVIAEYMSFNGWVTANVVNHNEVKD